MLWDTTLIEDTSPNDETQVMLKWLWDVAVDLVLTELGFVNALEGDNSLPRIWWITSGLLARLPCMPLGIIQMDQPLMLWIELSHRIFLHSSHWCMHAKSRNIGLTMNPRSR